MKLGPSTWCVSFIDEGLNLLSSLLWCVLFVSIFRWRAAEWRNVERMMNWWNWAANISIPSFLCFSICGQATLPPTVCVSFFSFLSVLRWREATWPGVGRMMNWWNSTVTISILCCCRFCFLLNVKPTHSVCIYIFVLFILGERRLGDRAWDAWRIDEIGRRLCFVPFCFPLSGGHAHPQ